MIRLLLALSVFVVLVQSQTTKKFVPPPACYYPWYVQGSFKTGKTSCTVKTIATDCADTVADCVTHPYTKKTACCKPSPTAVWPICPNKKTLQYPNNNPALKAGVPCNPPSRKTNKPVSVSTCETGYGCVRATNDFTRIELATANVCCSLQ